MVQHELLMVVAAPLVAAGAPLIALLWAVPAGFRRRGLESVRRRPITLAWAFFTAPAVVFVLHGIALWIWHLPALYDYALEHEAVHAVQHSVSSAPRRCSGGASATAVTAPRLRCGCLLRVRDRVHAGVLGALLTLSPRVWYARTRSQAGADAARGSAARRPADVDPAGVVLPVLGLVLFAAWLRESDRRTRYNPRRSVRRTTP